MALINFIKLLGQKVSCEAMQKYLNRWYNIYSKYVFFMSNSTKVEPNQEFAIRSTCV